MVIVGELLSETDEIGCCYETGNTGDTGKQTLQHLGHFSMIGCTSEWYLRGDINIYRNILNNESNNNINKSLFNGNKKYVKKIDTFKNEKN